mgnify:CR=1 FL=1
MHSGLFTAAPPHEKKSAKSKRMSFPSSSVSGSSWIRRSIFRAVQITIYQDWLLVQAGWLSRRFDRDDLGGYIDFFPFRRYAFAPGRRVMWEQWGDDRPWTRMDRIKEPFQSQRYETEAASPPQR